ncbi:MAG TPA: hypothetical protein PLV25_08115, partial [Opitutales bacterium]|nr:hypothetical protein [Opitutales bacterium]
GYLFFDTEVDPSVIIRWHSDTLIQPNGWPILIRGITLIDWVGQTLAPQGYFEAKDTGMIFSPRREQQRVLSREL